MLYVIIMSRTSFRVNLHSIVSLNVRRLLAYIWSLSDSNGIRTRNLLLRKRTLNHSTQRSVWLNGWVFVYELSGCEFESRCCHLNWFYWYTKWLLGKDSFNFVSAIHRISIFLSTILSKSPTLFLMELIFRYKKMMF